MSATTPYEPVFASYQASESRRQPVDDIAPEGARRVLNVVVAAIGIVMTAPLMLGIAALIKLTSPGPAFYAQTRVGLNRRKPGEGGHARRKIDYGGKPFTIFKFRTMRVADPAKSAQVWATQNDPRVTAVGRVLRKYRLDELPQLFNVLRGDMNIVGPRPEQPDILVQLRSQVANYDERQRVRPGITGWAQINLPYDMNVDDVRRKIAYDLQYVERHSLVEDLKIMIQTAPVMVFRKGAW